MNGLMAGLWVVDYTYQESGRGISKYLKSKFNANCRPSDVKYMHWLMTHVTHKPLFIRVNIWADNGLPLFLCNTSFSLIVSNSPESIV